MRRRLPGGKSKRSCPTSVSPASAATSVKFAARDRERAWSELGLVANDRLGSGRVGATEPGLLAFEHFAARSAGQHDRHGESQRLLDPTAGRGVRAGLRRDLRGAEELDDAAPRSRARTRCGADADAAMSLFRAPASARRPCAPVRNPHDAAPALEPGDAQARAVALVDHHLGGFAGRRRGAISNAFGRACASWRSRKRWVLLERSRIARSLPANVHVAPASFSS